MTLVLIRLRWADRTPTKESLPHSAILGSSAAFEGWGPLRIDVVSSLVHTYHLRTIFTTNVWEECGVIVGFATLQTFWAETMFSWYGIGWKSCTKSVRLRTLTRVQPMVSMDATPHQTRKWMDMVGNGAPHLSENSLNFQVQLLEVNSKHCNLDWFLQFVVINEGYKYLKYGKPNESTLTNLKGMYSPVQLMAPNMVLPGHRSSFWGLFYVHSHTVPQARGFIDTTKSGFDNE